MAAQTVPTHITSSYAATPPSIRSARDMVVAFAREHGFDGEDLEDIALAVSEAASNVVMHAYRDMHPGTLEVQARRLSSAQLVVTITDCGCGVRPRTDSPGLGLGLPLIARVASTIDVEDCAPGARIRMTFSATG